jgi:hypothetical protein
MWAMQAKTLGIGLGNHKATGRNRMAVRFFAPQGREARPAQCAPSDSLDSTKIGNSDFTVPCGGRTGWKTRAGRRLLGNVRNWSSILYLRRDLYPHRGHGPRSRDCQLRMFNMRRDDGKLEHRLGSDLSPCHRPNQDGPMKHPERPRDPKPARQIDCDRASSRLRP